MNVEHKIEPTEAFAPEDTDAPQTAAEATPVHVEEKFNTSLLAKGFGPLQDYLVKSEVVAKALTDIAGIADRASIRAARKLQRELAAFEPSVTMIGQVKAGKTSLVNAMIGTPDLCRPTSTPGPRSSPRCTSTARAPRAPRPPSGSSTTRSGHRCWQRAGASASWPAAPAPTRSWRKSTPRSRDARDIAPAAGQTVRDCCWGRTHDYGYVDAELIQRYVCLGDEFDADNRGLRGHRTGPFRRYHAIGRPLPERSLTLPMPICLRDTPGVNDTFMMREQITIERHPRQPDLRGRPVGPSGALDVDLALIRLISNVKSRRW